MGSLEVSDLTGLFLMLLVLSWSPDCGRKPGGDVTGRERIIWQKLDDRLLGVPFVLNKCKYKWCACFLLAQLGSVFTRFALCIHFQYLEIDVIPKQANIDSGGRN